MTYHLVQIDGKIVNLAHVSAITPREGGGSTLLLKGGIEIAVSKNVEQVKQILNAHP